MPTIVTAQARHLKMNMTHTSLKDTRMLGPNSFWTMTYWNEHTESNVSAPTCLAPHLQQEWEAIDGLRHEGVTLAERKCRKLHKGAVPWSPDIQRAREQVEIWGLILKKKLGRHISSSLLQWGMKKFWISDHIQDISLKMAIHNKWVALKEYRELKKLSWSLQQTHLEDLAAAKAAVGNTSKAAALRQLQTHEHQRAMAHRVRYIYGNLRMGGVTNVIAPDSTGTMVEMTAKEDMEKAIMEENVQKFLQAMDTPFMTQPLLRDFGYMGLGSHATEVMMGQYDIPESIHTFWC